jgi:hypothetical protein
MPNLNGSRRRASDTPKIEAFLDAGNAACVAILNSPPGLRKPPLLLLPQGLLPGWQERFCHNLPYRLPLDWSWPSISPVNLLLQHPRAIYPGP